MTYYAVWSLKRGAINPAEPVVDSEHEIRMFMAHMEELSWRAKNKAEREYA